MHSKIAGCPIHPMLIAFRVVCYTGTLVGFAAYAANGHLFWLNLAVALSVAGVGGAVIAAIPGLADWAFGIPRDSAAKMIGLAHAGLNMSALGLFAAVIGIYVADWNGPAVSAATGIVLSAIGVAVALAAGFLAGRWCRTTTPGSGWPQSRNSPNQQSSTISRQSHCAAATPPDRTWEGIVPTVPTRQSSLGGRVLGRQGSVFRDSSGRGSYELTWPSRADVTRCPHLHPRPRPRVPESRRAAPEAGWRWAAESSAGEHNASEQGCAAASTRLDTESAGHKDEER